MPVLAAVLALAAFGASAHASSSVDRFLDRTWPEQAGGTAIAARDGKIVTCKGFGMADRAKRVRADCDTVYDVMSITKQFTAAAILKLETMGKLRVTDPLSRFVGPVPEDKRGITLDHLLTHTAGLVDGLGGDYDVLSREEMLRRGLSSRLRSAPGRKHRYSNLGYSILAAVVEKASGMGYEAFLATRLFRPAGMRRTGYVLPRWDRDRVAVEYDRRGRPQGRPFDHPWADDGPYWNLHGNGGILSTPRDMFRWHRALRGDKVLTSLAKRKLFKPRVREEAGGPLSYGYGWETLSNAKYGKLVTHNGGNGWSLARYARFLDKDLMVFWVTNRAYGKWNFDRLEATLTLGTADRVDAGG